MLKVFTNPIQSIFNTQPAAQTPKLSKAPQAAPKAYGLPVDLPSYASAAQLVRRAATYFGFSTAETFHARTLSKAVDQTPAFDANKNEKYLFMRDKDGKLTAIRAETQTTAQMIANEEAQNNVIEKAAAQEKMVATWNVRQKAKATEAQLKAAAAKQKYEEEMNTPVNFEALALYAPKLPAYNSISMPVVALQKSASVSSLDLADWASFFREEAETNDATDPTWIGKKSLKLAA